jgi:hypothetical protein
VTNPLQAAAIDYAAAGWRVFPCQPGGKIPLFPTPHPKGSPERANCRGECGRVGHGVLDATTDPSTITAWWTRNPTANVAIATGAPGPDVIDVDTKHGLDGLELYNRVRAGNALGTPFAVVATPSGGLHAYYHGSTQGGGAVGRSRALELKAAGGYVLAPPSSVSGRRYALQTTNPGAGAGVDFAAVRSLLDPPRPVRIERDWGKHNFEGLIKKVADSQLGNGNRCLYWAACCAARDGADEGVFDALVEASVSAGHPRGGAVKTVASARRRVSGGR